METEKVSISGVPETMLQTLYARAKETESDNPHIEDKMAVEMVSRLDYDFSKADTDSTMSTGVIARTILLDKMVNDYLREKPGALIINIACGLDTRCYRMAGKYSCWYNLDLPETMAVRRRFFTETDSIKQIAASAMDESWAKEISAEGREVLVIIEGLTMYLSEDEVKKIFNIIDKNFASAEVFVETMNPFVVRHIKEKSIEGSQAKFSWGVKDGRELEKLISPFKSLSDRSLAEGMAVLIPAYKFLSKIGFVRNISNKILVFKK